MQIGSFSPYWIVAIVALFWLFTKIYDFIRDMRIRHAFRKNANYYSGILAKTLQEVNIIDKTLLVKEDVQLIKSTLDQMPSAQAIKNLKRYLTRYEISLNNYRSQIKKLPVKEIRERFTIPLMLNFIYLFGLINPTLKEFIHNRKSFYIERGFKERVYAAKLLNDTIEKAISLVEL